MPIDTGLVLPGYRPFSEILAPLPDELERCFWVVDVQAGIFNGVWMLEPANERLIEQLLWRVPGIEHTSTLGLRPGSFPRLAPQVNVDEWSSYFALNQPEDRALRHANELARHVDYFSEEFLRHLDSLVDLFICHVDGWWEFYSGREDWLRSIRRAWPNVRERSIVQAGNPL